MNIKLRILRLGLLLLLTHPVYGADSKGKVVDLNHVDLEQVEDNWDNAPTNPKVDTSRLVKIKDIIEPTSDYTYASFGKPDPFALPPEEAKPVEVAVATPMKVRTPGSKEILISSILQSYQLNELHVRGIWQLESGEMRAIISPDKGGGVVVRVGDPISSGKVLQIKKDSVIARLYRLKKDGVREYDDQTMGFGAKMEVVKGSIKLEPGKDPIFPVKDKNGEGGNGKGVTHAPDVSDPLAAGIIEGAGGAGGRLNAPFNQKPSGSGSGAAAPAVPASQAAAPAAAPAVPASPPGTPPGWPYNTTPVKDTGTKSTRPGSQ